MIVLIDGKEVKIQNDIKVIYDDVVVDMDDDGSDINAELHVTMTHEGQILDLITTETTPDGDAEVIGTHATEYGEMASLCQNFEDLF